MDITPASGAGIAGSNPADNAMEIIRPDWDSYFLFIAWAVSLRGDCRRAQVGAVIVKGNRIVATGYNGTPADDPRSCLSGDCPRGLKTREELPGHSLGNHAYHDCIALHAEMNAIAYANHQDTVEATLYLWPCVPCDMCSKLVKAAGISRIVTPM